jgi:branched-chain amino acid transport system substrate-binding protein
VSKPSAYKFGMDQPLSGPGAGLAQWIHAGADMAAEDVNAAGGVGGVKIELLYEDNGAKADLGIAALNKFTSLEGIQVVAAAGSPVVLAIAPVADQNSVVVLSPMAGNAKIAQAGEFTFSIMPTNDQELAALAEYATKTAGLKTAGMIYRNDDAGLGGAESFKAAFTRNGGSIAADLAWDPQSPDFRTQIAKLQSSQPDLVYLYLSNSSGLLLRQARELGYAPKKWVSQTIFEQADVLTQAAGAAEGVVYSSVSFDPALGPAATSFAQRFKAKYDYDPNIFCATNYDAIKILASAIGSVGYDGKQVRTWLLNLKDYRGVSGTISFGGAHGVTNPHILLKTVKDGKFAVLPAV